MTNNFIEYPNPSLGYPKLITQTILANTAVTDTLKATIFIISISILSPKSHLLLLYHQICVLNLRRRKLPLSLCARLEDRRCTHCTKINKNLKSWNTHYTNLICCVVLGCFETWNCTTFGCRRYKMSGKCPTPLWLQTFLSKSICSSHVEYLHLYLQYSVFCICST